MSCHSVYRSLVLFAVCAVAMLPCASADTPKFKQYAGKYIQLEINVGTPAEAEDLVAAFDAATSQWAAFWKLAPDALDDWSVDAIVMRDRESATIAGLMQPRIPDFKFGYAAGNTVYVINQPSPYYTEHLLLHEGIHSLAQHVFGGLGPTWFMEGTAELLATHRGRGAAVEINRIPLSRETSAYWGRLKLIRELRERGEIPTVETIMKAPPRLDGDVNDYTWNWAVCMLLTEYPPYNEAFQALTLAGHDSTSELTRQLYQRLMPDWPALVARFRLMTQSLDYGFDWDRERVELSSRDPIWTREPLRMSVQADRGWQSIGHVIPAGTSLAIQAGGDCVLARDPQPWRSEPAGVTIRYHDGEPLGKLIACVVPAQYDRQARTLPAIDSIGIGTSATIKIDQPSWLVFRINDAVGELADNSGGYDIQVQTHLP